ncbi:MAG TPA: amidohydrolase family protein [Vicinamibacterales bacterium]|jgi:L-fuconolactonase|nr:amidohydrolase family protein [Vicinamibacterales bacterium]
MIDTHQHYWRYDRAAYEWIDDSMAALQRDFLPPDALREMVRAGVTASIAVQARQALDETRFLLELSDRYPFIIGVVGWIDLQAGDVEAQLAEFFDRPALVGVRHIVQAEPDGFLARPAFLSAMAQLERTGLVYDILVYARQLPQAVAFARAFPRQPFVLDHLGKPDVKGGGYREWRRHFDELAALGNVACKLSGLVTEADWRSWTPGLLRPYIDAALESFGPSRVMLGSDWPVCTVAATYEAVVGLVLEAIGEYSEAEKLQILELTAQQTYFRLAAKATREINS